MKKNIPDPPIQPATPLQYLIHFLEAAIDAPESAVSNILKALYLAKDLYPYLNKNIPKEEKILKKISDLTKNTDWEKLLVEGKTVKKLNSAMLSGAYECHFLKMVAQMIQANRILEIGMFTGYSTLVMASSLPKQGVIVTCEEEPFLVEFVKPFFKSSGYQNQIQIRLAPALQTLTNLAEEKQTFDLIFIDAKQSRIHRLLFGN